MTNDNFGDIIRITNFGKGVISMTQCKKSITLSMAVCFVVSAVLLVLVFLGPWLFELYMVSYRGFEPGTPVIEYLKTVFGWCFYPCAVFSAIILYSLIKLLFNIKNDEVFTLQNIKYLKTITKIIVCQ